MSEPTCPYCQTLIRTHPATRCLDALIADKVLGEPIHQEMVPRRSSTGDGMLTGAGGNDPARYWLVSVGRGWS